MGLRARLLLLVLLPAIPALLLALYTNFQLRKLGAAKVENDAMKLVLVAAASQSGLVEATRQHLAALARFPEARGNETNKFTAFFAGMTKAFTNYTDFGLIEKDGNLVARSIRQADPTNLCDRPHLQRVLKTRDLAIGEFQDAGGTNPPSLLFGYPILDASGNVVRVVYAALNLAALNKSIVVSELPEGGVIQILDRSGRVLGCYPDSEQWVGSSISNSPLFAAMLAKEEGSLEMTDRDGVPMLYAFSSIRNGQQANLFVNVGIPTAMAYAGTRRILLLNLAILGVVAVSVLLAAWIYANRHVLSPVKKLATVANRVAAGDLSARTGIPPASGELHQLAGAFDEMAASLQRQRNEINELNATLERRVAQRTVQLELSNQELEAFSYSVSHDLRAPLRHVGAYVEMLSNESGSALSEKGRRFLATISQAARQMGDLIDDLLAFSRLGRGDVSRSLIQMDQPVHEVLQQIKGDANDHNIRWEIDPLPEVFADEAMIRQVWMNLFSNAVKYTRHKEQPEVKVGCCPREAEIEFYVRDNGAGFNMEYVDKLFGVFQRLHSAREFEGTGIGLAIVRRIVSRHGGKTWAEGKVGEGATFHFTLPNTGIE